MAESDVERQSAQRRPRVVVAGGGFAGLAAAKALRKAPVDVVLVDRHNYHLFTPLLYQVASSLLDPSEIAHPIRAILRGQRNARFRMAGVESVDLDGRKLGLDDGETLDYDYLILALGSVTNYFGNDALRRETLPLKGLPDALAIRYRVLEQFEAASATTDPDRRRHLMTFAVVGAGPTGVEYSGALSELIRLVLRKDFPELDFSQVRIVLIDALQNALPEFEPKLRRSAERTLRGKGIELELGSPVTAVEMGMVRLADGRSVEAALVVWVAGVRGLTIGRSSGLEIRRDGRISVEPTLQLTSHPEVLVAGDLAATGGDGKPLAMVAAVAQQEGRQAGRNVRALAEGKSPQPFRYFNRGVMATIGRNQAVAQIGPLRLSGRPAWFTWLFVHLVLIIGFRNRMIALVNWAWDYFFYDRPVRLITPQPRHEPGPDGGPGVPVMDEDAAEAGVSVTHRTAPRGR